MPHACMLGKLGWFTKCAAIVVAWPTSCMMQTLAIEVIVLTRMSKLTSTGRHASSDAVRLFTRCKDLMELLACFPAGYPTRQSFPHVLYNEATIWCGPSLLQCGDGHERCDKRLLHIFGKISHLEKLRDVNVRTRAFCSLDHGCALCSNENHHQTSQFRSQIRRYLCLLPVLKIILHVVASDHDTHTPPFSKDTRIWWRTSCIS